MTVFEVFLKEQTGFCRYVRKVPWVTANFTNLVLVHTLLSFASEISTAPRAVDRSIVGETAAGAESHIADWYWKIWKIGR